MQDSDLDQKRKFAALAYALGVARGVLSGIADGDYTEEEAQRVYNATSAYRIAESLGLPETALDVDWNDYLTSEEKNKIAGYDNAG